MQRATLGVQGWLFLCLRKNLRLKPSVKICARLFRNALGFHQILVR